MKIKRIFLIVLILCSVSYGVNNFAGEPNLVSMYTFDTGSDFFLDSTDNNNDLVATLHPLRTAVDKKEGTYSADFESTLTNFMILEDDDASADFPCKVGQTNTTFTIMLWYKPEAIVNSYLVSQFTHATSDQWAIVISSSKINLYWGYNNGALFRAYVLDKAMANGNWYFVKAVFDDPNNLCSAMIYSVLDSSTTTVVAAPADDMIIEGAPFRVGCRNSSGYMDGLMDNLCVFSRVLSDADANDVRDGTFDFESEPNLVARYMFEDTELGIDETGKNNIQVIFSAADPKVGTGCADFELTKNHILYCPDGDLSANFPGKNGDDNTDLTVCFWFKQESTAAEVMAVNKREQRQNRSWQIGVSGPAADTGANWSSRADNVIEYVDSGREPSLATWYHCGVVYTADYAEIRLYDTGNTTVYSGVIGDYTGVVQALPGAFCIGANMANGNLLPGTALFDGMIDDVQIFNRVLTAEEIDQIRSGTFGTEETSAAQVI